MANTSFFQDLLGKIADRGRQLLDLSISLGGQEETIEDNARALMSSRGEASGVALARRILEQYRALTRDQRRAFFHFVAEAFCPDVDKVRAAAERFLADSSPQTLRALATSVESPRQEFLRRLNLAPGATARIVAMRTDLLGLLRADPALAVVDADFVHLLSSWFNRGFLVLQRIDWSTPAAVLEKIIRYEAVHQIRDWDDLRRRLDPADRRCYAFFHPSLVDEPLIFVQVALGSEISDSIQDLLAQEPAAREKTARPGVGAPAAPPTTAVFYSISNCQKGLRGISFGSFLIKQVAENLAAEIPSLKTYVTLSPAPGFRAWLDTARKGAELDYLSDEQRALLDLLDQGDWMGDEDKVEALRPVLMALAAHYYLRAKTPAGLPLDPVARFHLGNGARLERINWLADVSDKGIRESYGVMVNYRYVLKDIERNHEAYVNEGTITVSRQVQALLLAPEQSKSLVPAVEMASGGPGEDNNNR